VLATRGLHDAIASKPADIHLRIRTLIGAAGCWLVRGPREAIGSNHGLSWIIATSELLPRHSGSEKDGTQLNLLWRIILN
jgi:hypothetical protein